MRTYLLASTLMATVTLLVPITSQADCLKQAQNQQKICQMYADRQEAKLTKCDTEYTTAAAVCKWQAETATSAPSKGTQQRKYSQ
jgi:hypothetical protein